MKTCLNRMFASILTASIGFGASHLNAQTYSQPWGSPQHTQQSAYPTQNVYPSGGANHYGVPGGSPGVQTTGAHNSTQQYAIQQNIPGGYNDSNGVSSNGNPGHVAYNTQMSGNGFSSSTTVEAGIMRNPQTMGEVFQRNDPHSRTNYLAGAQYQNTTTTPSGMKIQNTVGGGLVADYDHSFGVSHDINKGETFYGAKGSVRAGAQVEAASKRELGTVGSVPISTETKGSVFVGAEAEGKAGITTGKDQVQAGVGAEAFVGAKATASQNVTAGPVGGTVTGEAWAGAGVDVGANVTYKNGKIGWETDAKAGLGVGGGASVDGTVDVGQVYQSGKKTYQRVDGWADQQGQRVDNFANQQGQRVDQFANQTQNQIRQTTNRAWNKTQNSANQSWNQTQNTANQAWRQTRNTTNQTWNKTQNNANQAWNKTQNTTRNASNNVQSSARNASKNVKRSTRKVTKNVSKSAKQAGNKIKGLFGK